MSTKQNEKLKQLRTLRHRLLSLEHNLVCAGIECKELRTIDDRLLSDIALSCDVSGVDFEFEE